MPETLLVSGRACSGRSGYFTSPSRSRISAVFLRCEMTGCCRPPRFDVLRYCEHGGFPRAASLSVGRSAPVGWQVTVCRYRRTGIGSRQRTHTHGSHARLKAAGGVRDAVCRSELAFMPSEARTCGEFSTLVRLSLSMASIRPPGRTGGEIRRRDVAQTVEARPNGCRLAWRWLSRRSREWWCPVVPVVPVVVLDPVQR